MIKFLLGNESTTNFYEYCFLIAAFNVSVNYANHVSGVLPFNNLIEVLEKDSDDPELCHLSLALINSVSCLLRTVI